MTYHSRIALAILIAIVFILLAYLLAPSAHSQTFVVKNDKILVFFRPWDNSPSLILQRHGENQWHPSLVSITSQYQPTVKKLPNGEYEISFSPTAPNELP